MQSQVWWPTCTRSRSFTRRHLRVQRGANTISNSGWSWQHQRTGSGDAETPGSTFPASQVRVLPRTPLTSRNKPPLSNWSCLSLPCPSPVHPRLNRQGLGRGSGLWTLGQEKLQPVARHRQRSPKNPGTVVGLTGLPRVAPLERGAFTSTVALIVAPWMSMEHQDAHAHRRPRTSRAPSGGSREQGWGQWPRRTELVVSLCCVVFLLCGPRGQ